MQHRALTLFVLATLLFALSACEQDQSDGAERSEEIPAQAEEHVTEGTVTAINTDAGRVTVAHEPVASLDWPAMTMQFAVEDPNMLDDVNVDDEISFTFVQTESNQHIIRDITKQ